MRRGERHRVTPIAVIAVFASALSLLTFAAVSAPTVLYDASVDFVEGFMIYNGLQVLRGAAYRDSPYVYPYPPLAYVMSALSASAAPTCPIIGCRLFSLAASVAILALCWLEAGRDKFTSLLAPAITALCPAFLYWAALCRADQPAVLLSIISIALFSRKLIIPSALAASMALMFKQSYVAAPLAILTYLAVTRRLREAARYLAALSAFTACLYLPLFIATGGALGKHLLIYNLHAVSLSKPLEVLRGAFSGGFWVVYVPLLIPAYLRVREDPYAAYYVISFALATALSLKVGANTNYFIEAASIGGIQLAREMSRLKTKLPVALLCCVILASLALNPPTYLLNRVGDPSLIAESRTVASSLRGAAVIASEDAYIAVLSGSELAAEPFIYRQLVSKGVFDDYLVDLTLNSSLDAAVLRWDDPSRFTTEFRTALMLHYNCSKLKYYTVCFRPGEGPAYAPSETTIPDLSLSAVQQWLLGLCRLILLFENWIALASIFTLPPILIFGGWLHEGCGDTRQKYRS